MIFSDKLRYASEPPPPDIYVQFDVVISVSFLKIQEYSVGIFSEELRVLVKNGLWNTNTKVTTF